MRGLRISPGTDLLVDREGNVFLPDGTPKHQYGRHGYYCVKRNQKAFLVHRLVAKAFIPNPDNKSDVNHINGDKSDNRVSNLEWMTRTENLYHAMRTGLHDNPEKPVVGVCKETGRVVEFVSSSEAARETSAYQPNISKCLMGLRRSAGGFEWSFA